MSYVNYDSANGLVPWGNEASPEQMFIQIYVAICHH